MAFALAYVEVAPFVTVFTIFLISILSTSQCVVALSYMLKSDSAFTSFKPVPL